MRPMPDLADLHYVINRAGTEVGRVVSRSRRCTLTGCAGIRVGVKWPDGSRTYPCSKGLTATSHDTWQIA